MPLPLSSHAAQQLPLITPDSSWTPPTCLPDLRHHARIAVDVENRDDGLAASRGSGWPYGAGHLCGVAVAWPAAGGAPPGSLYAPLRHPDTAGCFPPDAVRRWLGDHFAAPGLRVVMHHAQHDVGWLGTELGLPPPLNPDDTEAAAVMVDENRLTYNLDDLCRWRGIPGKDERLLREAAAAYGVDPKGGMHALPARYVGPYAGQDAAATLALMESLEPVMDAEGTRAAYQLEVDLIPMIAAMRRRGIRVDTELAARNRDHIIGLRDAVFEDLRSRIGERVGMEEIGRTAWLERVFRINAPGVAVPRTAPTSRFPTGQASFTAGSTGWMGKSPHWLPQLVARADRYNNAATKFLQSFILDYAHRGRIHATINQYRGEEGGTRTHRFSYSDPALQQMIGRDRELTPLIRDCFLAEEGEFWLKPDVSQQEYRLNVHFSERCGLPKAREAGDVYRGDPEADFHRIVSAWVELERGPAKDVNFAKSYRAGVPKFAAMIGKPVEEAREIYAHYDRELPFVSELGRLVQGLAERRGYVKLLDGARLHFDRWEPSWREEGEGYEAPLALAAARAKWPERRLRRAFCYMAVNGLIQGSAARQTKLMMREMWHEGFTPLLQMHDAVDTSVSSEAQGTRIRELMEGATTLTVPVRVDAKYGRSWGDAKHTWDEVQALYSKDCA